MSKTASALAVLMLAFGLSAMAVGSGDPVLRRQVPLRAGWLVRQLDTDKADVTALAREALSPDKSWMPARMPAQVHELLLAQGLIPDPHVGNNDAASAWVGEKDWAYLCRFPTPDRIDGPVFLRFDGPAPARSGRVRHEKSRVPQMHTFILVSPNPRADNF